jgi:hypothetical protein
MNDYGISDMMSDNLERFEDKVRDDLASGEESTLDYFAREFDLKTLLTVYASKGFQAACDWLADEYESCVTMLAVEREAEADHEEYDLYLENRARAVDMNLER